MSETSVYCAVAASLHSITFHIQRDSDIVESSQDATRLQVIFSEMAACKDDSQQRSWALHEDESVITEYLQELISILVRLMLFPTLQHFA